MSDFTFLTTGQIFGDNNTERLDIFKKLGSLSAITDFSILLGGYVNDDYHANRLNNLANRTGWWWTKTCDGDNDARVVVLWILPLEIFPQTPWWRSPSFTVFINQINLLERSERE